MSQTTANAAKLRIKYIVQIIDRTLSKNSSS